MDLLTCGRLKHCSQTPPSYKGPGDEAKTCIEGCEGWWLLVVLCQLSEHRQLKPESPSLIPSDYILTLFLQM